MILMCKWDLIRRLINTGEAHTLDDFFSLLLWWKLWLIRSKLFEVFLLFKYGLIILYNVIRLLQQGILLKVAEIIKSWILAQCNKNDDLLHKLVSVHSNFWHFSGLQFVNGRIDESEIVLLLIWAVTDFD